MKTALIALAASFGLSIAGLAAETDEAEEKHPIDIKVEKLADEANSTAETIAAYDKGFKLWDKEMNRVYQELKKGLPEKSFAVFKASQVQWLAYRDAQIAFINSCYDQYDGTMFGPMRVSAVMEVTRARVLDLSHRLDMHKEHANPDGQ